jgi:hypothetical protein
MTIVERTLYERFQQPNNEFRGKPFWSWNGELDGEELLRQLDVFEKMGFGGFFMHSRTGLITEYMGDEWLDFINRCTDEAEKRGMEAWLYDEDRWPSGTAGGLVTAKPEYRLKFMRLCVVTPPEYAGPADSDIATFVCRLEGLALSDCRRIDDHAIWDASQVTEGESILVFTVEEQNLDTFYNGNTYVDTMNPEAIDAFIKMTHEKYKDSCGDRLGKSIRGIFTDEPHRGALMDGFGMSNASAHWLAPWTDRLFDSFEKKYGYRLEDKLPELFLQPEGRAVSQVKWHYVDLLQELFLDAFSKPLDRWCKDNRIELTGHTLHEDSLTAQTAMVGSVMRFYEHMGYPGVDVLTEGNYNYWIVKQLTSVARQLGQKWLLSELYGCTGWQMPFEGHKAVGDWQALFGINLRCHHLSWYTMEGEAKRDFPGSIASQSAWWSEYEAVETYFSRLGVILSEGEADCSLLVLSPVESVWCQVYPGWSRGLSALSEDVKVLEENYKDVFHGLAGAQIDFDYGDEEMFSRLASVERAESGDSILCFGQAKYRAVLVAGMTTIRSTTIRLLKQFSEAGGLVVFAGDAPAYVDALPSGEAVKLAESPVAKRIPLERTALGEVFLDQTWNVVSVLDNETGEPVRDIFAQTRRISDGSIAVVAMNMDRCEWRRGVKVRIRGTGRVEVWNSLSSERRLVPARQEDAWLAFTADFPPSGEHVYIVQTETGEELNIATRYEDVVSEPLSGSYPYRLDEPNVCVLDRAAYRLDGGEWSAPMDILRVDRAIRDTFGIAYRSGEMLQPWYRNKYNGETLHRLGRLELRFSFNSDVVPENDVHLAVERPERLSIRLNGKPLDCNNPVGWWVDPCFKRIEIPRDGIVTGLNVVELSLDFHEGFDLEGVFLLGDFGVRLEGTNCYLTSLPSKLAASDIVEQGLPFYGGTITYEIAKEQMSEGFARLKAGITDGDKIVLALPSIEAGTARVRYASGESKLLPWQPFETGIVVPESIELDLILSRRNTFGPLHQLPLLTPGYAPENFVTEGEQYSPCYVLLPNGLLEQPLIVGQRASK